MRAYYFDDIPGDARAPHEAASPALEASVLPALGVSSWHIPVPDKTATAAATSTTAEEQEQLVANAALDPIASERSYKNRDVITISPRHMGDAYNSKIAMFFEEHMHEDEEARYILDGSGFFDVRDHSDARWVRIKVEQGDLIVLPAGVYHRFTPDEHDYIQAMRLFKDEPKWTPLNRGADTDANAHRRDYVAQRDGAAFATHQATPLGTAA